MSTGRLPILQAIAIVFIASFCTLVIEIIAGRMLAPYVGVNLYTWTSIIGVVLAGISLGNFAGGQMADRWASRQALGGLFLLSALATLAILPLLTFVGTTGATWTIPLMAKIVIYVMVIFFLPGFVLGMISPVVVKLTLRDLERTGKTVGMLYAWSTFGSILGTFATGFFLISTFGTRAIIFGIAAVLALTGVLIGLLRPRAAPVGTGVQLVLLLAVAGLTWQLYERDYHVSPYTRETNYFTIQVQARTFEDGKTGLALVLDHLIHSFGFPDDPTRLEYGYERVYTEVTSLKAETNPSMKTLFIGGGGYTYQRYIEATYPQATIDVLEIDPAVTEVAFEQFGIAPDTRIRAFNEDARLFFNRVEPGMDYDIIYGDAFNDLSIPYHLTTAEFAGKVHTALAPDGIYVVNVIDNFQKGEFARAYMNTLRQRFPYVYLLGLGESWRMNAQSTYIVVGAKQPLDLDRMRELATQDGQRMQSAVMPQEELEAYLASGRRIILTDDYAPVDQLLAPLFADRG